MSMPGINSNARRSELMTEERKSRVAALKSAWLTMREQRRGGSATELDAAVAEFLQLHRAETDTFVLEAFRHWQVRGGAEET